VLVDADTNMGNIDILTGINPRYNFLNYVLDNIPINNILYSYKAGLAIIPNSSGNKTWQDLTDTMHARILELLIKLKKNFEYIIIDTAGGLASLSLDIAVHSNKVLLVTTSEPTAINDTYAMIKILNSMKKNIPIDLLLNMVTSPSEVTDVYQRLTLVLDHFLDFSIGIAGYVILDGKVRQAVNQQEPFILLYKDSVAGKNIYDIADIIFESELVEQSGIN